MITGRLDASGLPRFYGSWSGGSQQGPATTLRGAEQATDIKAKLSEPRSERYGFWEGLTGLGESLDKKSAA